MILRRVGELDVIPKGYGVAYWHWDSLTSVVAPIPLNLVLGALHGAWTWSISAPMWWEGPRNRIMRRAMRRGYKRGLVEGKRRGYEEWTKMRDRQIIEANARVGAATDTVVRMTKILKGDLS